MWTMSGIGLFNENGKYLVNVELLYATVPSNSLASAPIFSPRDKLDMLKSNIYDTSFYW